MSAEHQRSAVSDQRLLAGDPLSSVDPHRGLLFLSGGARIVEKLSPIAGKFGQRASRPARHGRARGALRFGEEADANEADRFRLSGENNRLDDGNARRGGHEEGGRRRQDL